MMEFPKPVALLPPLRIDVTTDICATSPIDISSSIDGTIDIAASSPIDVTCVSRSPAGVFGMLRTSLGTTRLEEHA